jgi:hypothetical protein
VTTLTVERDGFGNLMLSNGEKFSGGFKNGVIHGHGTYIKKNGQQVQG